MKRSLILSVLFLGLSASAAAAPAPAPASDPSAEAIAAAEKHVASQGYTDLQPKAVGARLDSGIWFVGFRSTAGPSIHGIMINGQKIKRVSQNLKLDWLMTKPLPALDGKEAKEIAEKFAAKTKGLPKSPFKMTENRANSDGDPTNSWWAWFEKSPKTDAKPAVYAIVSIDKDTRQAKWIKTNGKPGKP
jgi:ribosomal protein L12E/L44/L45/RPP1/RPP2